MNHKWDEDPFFSGNIDFGEFLRKKRRLKRMTQEDMAKFLGTNPQTISRWELGVTSPPMTWGTEIIHKLGGEIVIINRREL